MTGPAVMQGDVPGNTDERDIGAEVLAARPPQVPWKTLCERYGMSRARLVQLRRKAAAREVTARST
jgi:hypothetical protein